MCMSLVTLKRVTSLEWRGAKPGGQDFWWEMLPEELGAPSPQLWVQSTRTLTPPRPQAYGQILKGRGNREVLEALFWCLKSVLESGKRKEELRGKRQNKVTLTLWVPSSAFFSKKGWNYKLNANILSLGLQTPSVT